MYSIIGHQQIVHEYYADIVRTATERAAERERAIRVVQDDGAVASRVAEAASPAVLSNQSRAGPRCRRTQGARTLARPASASTLYLRCMRGKDDHPDGRIP